MCDTCRSTATDLILDIVNKGYELPVAIRLARDMVVQSGLADPITVTTLDDIVKMSDDVTESGYQLTKMLAERPAQFATRLLLRPFERTI
jgi:hypothetical protein